MEAQEARSDFLGDILETIVIVNPIRMFEHINEIAILVSAILAIAIASMWYSPILFGPVWRRSMGRSISEEELSKAEMIRTTILAIVVHILFFGIITYFMRTGGAALQSLVTTGGFLLALVVTYTASLALWERRSYMYVLVHTGYSAIIIFGGIGVIAYWPW